MTPTPCPMCGTMLTDEMVDDEQAYRGPGGGKIRHATSCCREVLIAQLTAERAKVEEARKALESARLNFGTYFVYWSAEHEDDDCPNDDTCECTMVAGVNEAFKDIDAALEKLRGQ